MTVAENKSGRNCTICDVLVIGSGAGGLSAAITASALGLNVLVIEKTSLIGGSTAVSGGFVWIPGNPLQAEAGVRDTPEQAWEYLRSEAGNHFDRDRVDAFLDAGPRMIDFFQHETAVRFFLSPMPDYHAESPGGLTKGRSLGPVPFDGTRLGRDLRRLRPPKRELTFLGVNLGAGMEMYHFLHFLRNASSTMFTIRRMLAHAVDWLWHGRSTHLTNGNALAAGLLRSALDRRIEIRTDTTALALNVIDGRVTGAKLVGPNGPFEVIARRGVIAASGGFAFDPSRTRPLFPAGARSPAPPVGTGDGLALAEAVGGAVGHRLSNAAAWMPVSMVPKPRAEPFVFQHLIDRPKPGFIAVGPDARRFGNEAGSYHDLVQAMVSSQSGRAEVHAHLICDHPAMRRYGIGFVKPFPIPYRQHLRSGYLMRARNVGELAQLIGVDPAALIETVDSYNRDAAAGRDSQFGRGMTAHSRHYGDLDRTPNPCVGPLDTAPYYAVRLMPGNVATFAGLRTDRDARVLRETGEPIGGLYAVGNDMMSPFGGGYPGAGATLGPAMTFGFRAAHALAREVENPA